MWASESITLRAYSCTGALEIGLDWDHGTTKPCPLGNVLPSPLHKNISMFPYWDLLSFLCLVLALKNYRIYFSNPYRSSFEFPQQMFLWTLSINALTKSCCLIPLPSQYLPLCYTTRGHLFLLSDYFSWLKIETLNFPPWLIQILPPASLLVVLFCTCSSLS